MVQPQPVGDTDRLGDEICVPLRLRAAVGAADREVTQRSEAPEMGVKIIKSARNQIRSHQIALSIM